MVNLRETFLLIAHGHKGTLPTSPTEFQVITYYTVGIFSRTTECVFSQFILTHFQTTPSVKNTAILLWCSIIFQFLYCNPFSVYLRERMPKIVSLLNLTTRYFSRISSIQILEVYEITILKTGLCPN